MCLVQHWSLRARSGHSLHFQQTAAVRTKQSSDQIAQMTGLDPLTSIRETGEAEAGDVSIELGGVLIGLGF
jgi:hypothetical protein